MDTLEKTVQMPTTLLIGTGIRIKRPVVHHRAFLPLGYTGVVSSSSEGFIKVKLDQPIEELGLWGNCITFSNQQNRTALTWFTEECEIIEMPKL
jgi:hypothetical protein